jgi:phosphoglycolate phosphatase-like HAD superfamily hydrolase
MSIVNLLSAKTPVLLSADRCVQEHRRERRDNGSVLVLFDIDGTLLLRASEEHAAALRGALADVYGVEATAKVAAAGRTDTAIARDLAALGGVEGARFDEGLARFKELTASRFAQCAPASLRDRVAPGIGELLASLAERGDVRCSLVSGNYEPVARLKLERAGIGSYFAAGQGAFGSDAEARNELPPIARARAGGHPRERTIVVGDTPLDIACARADGLRVLAVATGPHSASELTGADGVAADGWELAQLLAGELELSERAACS